MSKKKIKKEEIIQNDLNKGQLKKENIKESIHSEITKELKSTFSQPRFGLEKRTTNVMARIDENTSKVLDALVELELVPSRSAAVAFLILEAIKNNKEKYTKILESYNAIIEATKEAKSKAQYIFNKSSEETDDSRLEKEKISEVKEKIPEDKELTEEEPGEEENSQTNEK